MPKAGDLDWTDLMKGKVGEPESPLSKAVSAGKGADIIASQFAKAMANPEQQGPKQPTDKELFGHLVKSQEEIDAMNKVWEDTFKNFFAAHGKPVEKQDLNKSWGCRGPISKETLTEEEQSIRNIPTNVNDTPDEI